MCAQDDCDSDVGERSRRPANVEKCCLSSLSSLSCVERCGQHRRCVRHLPVFASVDKNWIGVKEMVLDIAPNQNNKIQKYPVKKNKYPAKGQDTPSIQRSQLAGLPVDVSDAYASGCQAGRPRKPRHHWPPRDPLKCAIEKCLALSGHVLRCSFMYNAERAASTQRIDSVSSIIFDKCRPSDLRVSTARGACTLTSNQSVPRNTTHT